MGDILERLDKYLAVFEQKDQIKGGLADNKTPEDIAKKHGVSVDYIKRQVEMGLKVEMEHTDDTDEAKKIAMDHLTEDPKYYTKLARMEKK